MTESKKLSFGPGFKFNIKKSLIENWKDLKEYYARKGRDLGDFPVMTDEEKTELAKQLENIK